MSVESTENTREIYAGGTVSLATYSFAPDESLATTSTTYVDIDEDFFVTTSYTGLCIVELSIGKCYNSDKDHSVDFQVIATGGGDSSTKVIACCSNQKADSDMKPVVARGFCIIDDEQSYTFTAQWKSSTENHAANLVSGWTNLLSVMTVDKASS